MPAAGSESPSWSNEDADDFWDEDLSDLEDMDSNVPPEVSTSPKVDITSSDGGEKIQVDSVDSGDVKEPKIEKIDEDLEEIPENKGSLSGDLKTGTKSVEVSPEIAPVDTVKKEESEIRPESISLDEKIEVNGGLVADISSEVSDHLKVTKETPEVSKNDSIEELKSENAIEPEKTVLEENGHLKTHTEKALEELEAVSDFLDEPADTQVSTSTENSNPGNVLENKIDLISETPIDDTPEVNGTINGTESNGNVKGKSVIFTDTPKFSASDLEKTSDSQISSLTKQVELLKLELDEKNIKLEQAEKTNEALKVSDNSPLADRLSELENALQQTELERDHAQGQLEGFLSKISSMKTVFQNYKETQRELEETQRELEQATAEKSAEKEEKLALQEQVRVFESENRKYIEEKSSWDAEKTRFLEVIETLKNEALEVNSECDRLSELLGNLRREFQNKEETLQDEKYSLENEVGRINKKLNELRNENSELELIKEEAVIENKNLVASLDELKDRLAEKDSVLHKLQAAADTSEKELEQKVGELENAVKQKKSDLEVSEAKYENLEMELASQKQTAEERAEQITVLEKEQEKIKALEEDVHGKQLVIGKLRHEAIILNEHLTKSISMLKQNSGDANTMVDRELVSNMMLNFLQIPRGDTKKFEALSLIGGLLEWDDQKKVQAGLIQSGRSDEKPQRSGIISMWTDFLDKESSKK